MSENPQTQMSVLQKLSSFEQSGQPDTLIQVFTWNCLFASAILKKNDPTSRYAIGFEKLFVKLDGFRWVLRFLGIFPTLEALVAQRHLQQPTMELQRIHLLKNILWFLYHPLERLGWLKSNTPELVSDLEYDGALMGRSAVKCWVINMVLDYYLMFRQYQEIKQKLALKQIGPVEYAAAVRDLFWGFLITSLWMPMAVNWASKKPFIKTELETGAICSLASGIQLALAYSSKK